MRTWRSHPRCSREPETPWLEDPHPVRLVLLAERTKGEEPTGHLYMLYQYAGSDFKLTLPERRAWRALCHPTTEVLHLTSALFAQSAPTNHVITFYRNGFFTVNNGPGRGVNDPANFKFIESISRVCASPSAGQEGRKQGARGNLDWVTWLTSAVPSSC